MDTQHISRLKFGYANLAILSIKSKKHRQNALSMFF